MKDFEELRCIFCNEVIGIIRYFRKYYKQPIPEFCHSQIPMKLPDRWCNMCGHFQLEGDTCEKCLIKGMWVYDEF